MQSVLTFLRNEEGPTAVEYAVMLAMILMVVLGTVTTLGWEMNALWQRIDTNLRSASSTT